MSSTRSVRIAIIGGGIVGLATALEITRRFPAAQVAVLEKEAELATHQTGHNSGVLHSGLYYAPGSLKARLSVRGLELLKAFCREHSVPHEICGKVVVATTAEELPRLRTLQERGAANGIQGMRMIGPEELRAIEPHATGIQALHVPTTGIVNYRAVSEKYAALIRAAGSEIRTGCRVQKLVRERSEWRIETTAGEFACDGIINCGGLHSDRIAALAGHQSSVRIIPFRGEYYKLRPESWPLVQSLIYPVPDPAFPFLGVHFTRMIGGGIEAGPNAVLALQREGYRHRDISVRDCWDSLAFPGFWKLSSRYWRVGMEEIIRSLSKAAFVRALQRLIPEITAADLEPGGAGVRAQALGRDGELVSDFQIGESPGAVHVINAPSPAATASLAIGEVIAERAAAVFGWTRNEMGCRAKIPASEDSPR